MNPDHHLSRNREIWNKKKVLREIYARVYRRVSDACRPGTIFEVGGGTGNFKNYSPDVISSDIMEAPWMDLVADGESLPLRDESIENLVVIDAMHHMTRPKNIFIEAERTLKPGGRLVIAEPVITPGSWIFYKLHPESFDMSVNPFDDRERKFEREKYDANQGIATLFFTKYLSELEKRHPRLRLQSKEWFQFFSYPLSGIFRNWSLIPEFAIKSILDIEDFLAPVLGRVSGFHIVVVFERE